MTWLIELIGLNSLEAGRQGSWEGERIKEKGVRRKDRSREVVKVGGWEGERENDGRGKRDEGRKEVEKSRG